MTGHKDWRLDQDCTTEGCSGWRNHAACRNTDPEAFQPEVASEDDVREVVAAYCAVCPVRRQCRELAEANVGSYGIHGGQWFGEDPRRPGAALCEWCEQPMEAERSTARYCGDTCSKRARRAAAAAAVSA